MTDMRLRTYSMKQITIGKRVLMRIDGNVPIKNGRVLRGADRRLLSVIPELQNLLKRGAEVTLMTHVGRPGGKMVQELSTAPLQRYFAKKLGQEVQVLENLRFNSGEEKNDASFAKKLAKHGDMYVNNAFGVCHRKHASIHAITRYIDSYTGSVLANEVKQLTKRYRKPMVLVIGGIKLESKIPVIEHLASKAGAILTAGGIAVSMVDVEQGKKLFAGGREITDSDRRQARKILREYASKVHLPMDFRTARSENFRKLTLKNVDDIKSRDRLFDVGPKTVDHYSDLIDGAKTVIWNGPLGLVEKAAAAKGTHEIAKSITEQKRTRSIVGGGDTVAFLDKKKLGDKFTFVSTGGGAMLAFLAGKKMPGIEVLQK